MTESELLEKVARLCHMQWAGWMRYLFGKGDWNGVSECLIGAESAGRWYRQMRTPYAELSESEKESDRKEARKFLECIGLTFDAYEDKAMRTADKKIDLWYAGLGLGEAGEVQNDIKKIYGHGYTKEEMRPKIKEELGDLLWYVTAVCRMMDIPLEEVATYNVDSKLAERYPHGFFKKGEQGNEGH